MSISLLTLTNRYKAETILPISKANIAANIPLNQSDGTRMTRDKRIHPSSKRVAVEMNFVFLWWILAERLKECKDTNDRMPDNYSK